MPRLLIVFGTRPEAIKLCPLIDHFRKQSSPFDVRVCVTGQHRSMLDQVLDAFDIRPDHDLDLMRPDQTLAGTVAAVIQGVAKIIEDDRPDMVVVQGDTTTTLGAALAGFYAHAPVAHVEAGLRTGDLDRPFPEEANRRLVSRLSTVHLAATEAAAANLRAEAVDAHRIFVTGNTVIDAVLGIRDRLLAGESKRPSWPFLSNGRKLILVTAHRRENFGDGLHHVCEALQRLTARQDVQIVYPVHRNPNVLDPVRERLGDLESIALIDPVGYAPFVDLMMRSHFILTDSGGIQEEAPSLGKPVLVMRETTERQEAVDAGTAQLVGTNPEVIVAEATRLLDDGSHYQRMAQAHNPYGDGQACERIAAALETHFTSEPHATNSEL